MGERPVRFETGRVMVVEEAAFGAACADWITHAVVARLETADRCTIALTGGSAVRPVYEALAIPPRRDRIAWGRLEVFWGDERCVPPDDPESNYRLARETLLDIVPIPPGQVHRMACESDRERAARRYEEILPPTIDVLLLGMGADGHTCSLFPGDRSLAERTRRVVAVHGGEPAVHRLTITPPVIAGAAATVMMVAGAPKAAMVHRVLEGDLDPERFPAQLALGATWILDPAAASRLTPEQA